MSLPLLDSVLLLNVTYTLWQHPQGWEGHTVLRHLPPLLGAGLPGTVGAQGQLGRFSQKSLLPRAQQVRGLEVQRSQGQRQLHSAPEALKGRGRKGTNCSLCNLHTK